MQPNLFDIPESLSPLAAWKQTHNVKTQDTWESDYEPKDDEDNRWYAFIESHYLHEDFIGTGPTESAACSDLARRVGINHWSMPL